MNWHKQHTDQKVNAKMKNRMTVKTNIISCGPQTAQGWCLFYHGIFCCILSDWREDLEEVVNCNSHQEDASTYHGSSDKYGIALHCVLVHAECLHYFIPILRGFSTLRRIFDTRYFCVCYKHDTITLFCSATFFFLWVFIITPAENISPPFLSPSEGWLKILFYVCSESRETGQWDQNWASQTEVHSPFPN